MTEHNIFIFGASGHAKVIIDIIEREGRHKIAYLVDDDPLLKDTDFFGYKILGGRNELLSDSNEGRPMHCIVAIGNNNVRRAVSVWLDSKGFYKATAIHPSVRLGRDVRIAEGTVIMAGAIINSSTVIGKDAIINTGAVIDHDCVIEDGCHIAPGTTICGSVHIGAGTLISAGSTIIPNLSIGSDTVIGAGATVVTDIPDFTTAVGTPARVISKRN